MIKFKAACDDSIRSFVFNNGGKQEFPILSLGRNSYINEINIQIAPGNEIANVHIGNFCSIAYNVNLLIDRNHDYKSISTSPLLEEVRKLPRRGQIIIGHDVWIGNDATILSGVRIGNGAVIGAGTVVAKDVPPYSIVVGNPMKIHRYRFEPEQIARLQNIKWWNWSSHTIEENRSWFGQDIEDFIAKFDEQISEPTDILSLEKKSTAVLFIPDFYEKYPIFKKVISEFIANFSSSDDISLLLRIEQNDEFDHNVDLIRQIISTKDNLPDILIINDIITDEKILFAQADYFITTRSLDTMRYIEFADEFGVDLISGVDYPLFSSITLKSDSPLKGEE